MAHESPATRPLTLNPDLKSDTLLNFEAQLNARVVGQERAVQRIAEIYQNHKLGLSIPGRPIGSLLFLGPTGSGKTRLVESTAEILHGHDRAFIKIDCGEFQNSHEVAKLIGSPPGYIGHRETAPVLSQEALDQFQHDETSVTIVLFDEIEKASDALWRLMLGILDKATLTLGDNRRVDFSRCIIVMTSNLGGQEISRKLMGSGLGFTSSPRFDVSPDVDSFVYRTAIEAAKRKFAPEFMNRIDKVVVFRPLNAGQLERVLDIELRMVQQRLMNSNIANFGFCCTDRAKRFLLKEGTDPQYGARPLKRTIERHLVSPLASLTATQQLITGDFVEVDYSPDTNRLVFVRTEGGAVASTPSISTPILKSACAKNAASAACCSDNCLM